MAKKTQTKKNQANANQHSEADFLLFENYSHSSGADPEILERGALYRPPRLINEEIFWEKISISIFKFSPFLYTRKLTNEILLIFQNLQTL